GVNGVMTCTIVKDARFALVIATAVVNAFRDAFEKSVAKRILRTAVICSALPSQFCHQFVQITRPGSHGRPRPNGRGFSSCAGHFLHFSPAAPPESSITNCRRSSAAGF